MLIDAGSGRESPIPLPASRAARRWLPELSDNAVGVLFIAPFIMTALFFMVYPVIEAVRMAFFSYNPLRPEVTHYVGLANFRFILSDPLFWDSFFQGTIWTLLSILFQTLLGVGIALLLNRALLGIAVFRGLLLFDIEPFAHHPAIDK